MANKMLPAREFGIGHASFGVMGRTPEVDELRCRACGKGFGNTALFVERDGKIK